MCFKVGDIVEVIEIKPYWEIYKDRHKIFKKPCRIIGMVGGSLYKVEIPRGEVILLLKKRLRPFIKVGQQLLFSFMGEENA